MCTLATATRPRTMQQARGRADAIQRMFQIIEQKYGDTAALVEKFPAAVATSGLLTVPQLCGESLSMLFTHKVAAIRVPQFYPKGACKLQTRRLLDSDSIQNWEVSSSRGLESTDVQSVGVPYNMAVQNGMSSLEKYFSDAIPSARALRVPVKGDEIPVMGPIDKLRLELDEVWPEGAVVGRDKATKRVLRPGIARVMRGPTTWMDGKNGSL